MNNKEKPSGTGTTSEARRKRRLGKQWDGLEKAGAAHRPDSAESMDTHIDQLHKALKEAKERKAVEGYQLFPGWRGVLQLLQHPRLEETHWALQTPISSRGRRTLEKVQEENAQEVRVLKRQRSLSKTKTGPRIYVEASNKALEKAREDLEAKKAAELGKAEADEALQAKSKPKSKARPKFKEELEQESLEKDTPGSSSAEPSLAALEKAAWEKRVKDQAKEFARPKKAKVCVDWRNTLEKGGIVPESHIQHLELLMQHCSVFICSYVKSKWREQEVKREVLALDFTFPCFSHMKNREVEASWRRCGTTMWIAWWMIHGRSARKPWKRDILL